jgi:hypothetical protein
LSNLLVDHASRQLAQQLELLELLQGATQEHLFGLIRHNNQNSGDIDYNLGTAAFGYLAVPASIGQLLIEHWPRRDAAGVPQGLRHDRRERRRIVILR